MKPTGPATLTVTEAQEQLIQGHLTSEEWVKACLARIALRDNDVAAWTHLTPELPLAAARHSDAQRKNSEKMGPLAGVPVALKDIIDTVDYPTENGTPVFAGRQPATNAEIVRQLTAAGAIILGKTVTTELAFFGPGKTRNPIDLERTPGGSSSGSAAAVTDFQVPLAIGTQTAGSIIRPAAYCGCIGFKPAFGYISRTGVLEQSAPLDTIGGYARSVPDLALLIDAIAGYDLTDRDMTSGSKTSLFAAVSTNSVRRPPQLAFIKTFEWNQVDEDARAALETLAQKLGSQIEIVETKLPPDFEGALRLQQIIQFSDIAKNYGPIADAHPDKVSDKLQEIFVQGRSYSAADYAAARADREPLYDAMRPILVNYDAILTPAAAGIAPKGLASTGAPTFNAVWTYLGMPCISLPLAQLHGLPLGIQLVGARDCDANLLQTAHWIFSRFG